MNNKDITATFTIPFIPAILIAIYAYLEFSANGITYPNLQLGAFLAAFFTFAMTFLITMGVYVIRHN